MTVKPFLTPHLKGRRFDGHSIPLEFLKDLSVLDEMLLEVAKWQFRQDHPDRKRSPRGFFEGVELKLTGLEDGSAKPVISLVVGAIGSGMLSLSLTPNGERYLEKARDAMIAAIGQAETNRKIEGFPDDALGYFDRMGRSLRDDEAIEFKTGSNPPVRLTKETRRRLILASSAVRELTEETEVRGLIPEADQEKMCFDVQLADGRRIPAPMAAQHREVILEAFNGYRQNLRVLLQGVGKFTRQERLERFDSIEHVSLLDPMDVPARLDELRSLKDGWLDGKGLELPVDGLDWLARQFDFNFPEGVPLPYIYPTAEGGVQAEWAVGDYESTLEIELRKRSGKWHSLNMLNSAQEHTRELNLDDAKGWAWLIEQLRIQKGGSA